MQRENSKSSLASSRGASASASGLHQPQKCTVRHHDEEQNLTYSIELALSYERVSSVSELSSSSSSDMHSSSQSQPPPSKGVSSIKTTPATPSSKFLPSREYDISLSVEVLSWTCETLYAHTFTNESWEAEVVFIELRNGKFQFMDYGNYVQFSVFSGVVLLQIPKVEREHEEGDAAEMEKLRLSNRTLCHRVAALELQVKQLKINPNPNMNLNLAENSNDSSLWNEIESHLRSELEEAKSQLEVVTADLKKITEAHDLLEKSFTNLQHSHTQLEQAKVSQSLSALEDSQVDLKKANLDLQRDLSLVQDKQTGVFLSLGCDGSGRDGSSNVKWNYEKVPLNGKYFLINDEKTEITIKEKGTYRFDVSVRTPGSSNNNYVSLYINGSCDDKGTISSPNCSQCNFRTIRRLDQENAKVKVTSEFDPNNSYKFNTFLIQRVD